MQTSGIVAFAVALGLGAATAGDALAQGFAKELKGQVMVSVWQTGEAACYLNEDEIRRISQNSIKDTCGVEIVTSAETNADFGLQLHWGFALESLN